MNETPDKRNTDSIDWSLATSEGSRRAQLRQWCALTLRERLLALDELTQLAERFAGMRQQGGLA